MANESVNEVRTDLSQSNDGYEAPRIQLVLTPSELEREVLYAGNGTSIP
jgi:hypothetical protein